MRFLLLFLLTSLFACSGELDNSTKSNSPKGALLTLVPQEKSNVSFVNQLNETETSNRFTYEYYYNGAGVGIGDINNDGLPDIYFCGNQTADRLYLNKGNMKFEDISNSGGITLREGWSSGVNFSDVNGDGFLDIYVCRSGPYSEAEAKRNLLFINNGNSTFTESANSYGLASTDHSVQSAFFDYDLDGDLDMYLLNHPAPSFKAKDLISHIDDVKSGRLRTDKFFENVNGRFVDKTEEAGLVNFGFRHGIAVGDLNDDNYPDLYISSDFDEPDLMYYNNGDKTFTNKIDEQIRHISNFSMGNEIADINNDGLNDIFVVDMTPEDHVRSKLNMASMNPRKFFAMADHGFHNQYMVNTLQLNMGDQKFSEVAQLMGVSKTDWSWAPLFFDIDMDGNKDLFVTNGVKRDILNNDVRINAEEKMKALNRRLSMNELIDIVPTTTVNNYVYKNTGLLKFKKTPGWMDVSSFNSNGAAYGDLDGDGDLDLVVNNVDKVSSIYENQSAGNSNYNYIKLRLKGPSQNPFAIGSKVKIRSGEKIMYYEVNNARGYLSSVDHTISVGLGEMEVIHSLQLTWPDGSVTTKANVSVNQTLNLDYASESKSPGKANLQLSKDLKSINPQSMGINYTHIENEYDDFVREILLPHRQSQNGPFISVADVNGDGSEDFFVGGAMGSKGALFIQTSSGSFTEKAQNVFSADKDFEDMGSVFLDIDKDGDLDLYVVSGGNELPESTTQYQDRLYINDGSGNFSKANNKLPKENISGQLVISEDVDNDGDLDLFVGGRIIPAKYPYPTDSKILINTNGVFEDKTKELAPGLSQLGMITGACFSDYDQDGDKDLIAVGEWTGILLFKFTDGVYTKEEVPSLSQSKGLWFSIKNYDYDGDGDEDYLVGNLGNNTKFKVGGEKAFHIYSKDFDGSGSNDIVLSNKYKGQLVPSRGRECSSEQMPFIKEKFSNYQKFAEASITDIFGSQLEDALHYEANILSSVLIKNNGSGNFEIIPLPTEAQASPIMDFEILNIDDDPGKEIIIVGNHYGAEVETVRYDASYGYVLKYDGQKLIAVPPMNTGLYTSGNSKDIALITIGRKPYLIVTNNDGPLDVFAVKDAAFQ
jgi:hypothetical protein